MNREKVSQLLAIRDQVAELRLDRPNEREKTFRQQLGQALDATTHAYLKGYDDALVQVRILVDRVIQEEAS